MPDAKQELQRGAPPRCHDDLSRHEAPVSDSLDGGCEVVVRELAVPRAVYSERVHSTRIINAYGKYC